MLIILIFSVLTGIFYFLGRVFVRRKKLFSFLNFLFFCFLIIEIFFYGYFLTLVHQNKSFYLIGHQRLLDHLIQSQIIDKTYLKRNQHDQFYVVDDELGYTTGKNRKYQQYETNAQGFRASRNYSLIPPSDKLRVAVFGDSFVFGDGELYQNVWPRLLERTIGNLEVLNFGLSGYGLTQSYLRYLKDGMRFSPDVVIFNYVTLGYRDRLDLKEVIKSETLDRSTLYRAHLDIVDGILVSESVKALDVFDPRLREKYIYQPFGLTAPKKDIFSLLNTGLFVKRYLSKRRFLKYFSAIGDGNNGVSQERFLELNVKLLDNLIQTVKNQGSKIIFLYSEPFDELTPQIQEILRKYLDDVKYVNINRLMQERIQASGHVRGDFLNKTNHFDGHGNKLYTEIVGLILIEEQWKRGDYKFVYNSKEIQFQKLNN